jgi:hypothetical protein
MGERRSWLNSPYAFSPPSRSRWPSPSALAAPAQSPEVAGLLAASKEEMAYEGPVEAPCAAYAPQTVN